MRIKTFTQSIMSTTRTCIAIMVLLATICLFILTIGIVIVVFVEPLPISSLLFAVVTAPLTILSGATFDYLSNRRDF